MLGSVEMPAIKSLPPDPIPNTPHNPAIVPLLQLPNQEPMYPSLPAEPPKASH